MNQTKVNNEVVGMLDIGQSAALVLWVVRKTKANVSVLFKWMQKVKIPILGSIYFSAIQLKMVMG